MKKVLGLGNALVDVLIKLDNDQILSELSLPKGSMQLVDRERAEKILHYTKALKKVMSSGGSAANTIHGLARLGINTGYIGAVGKDEYGSYFQSDLEDHKIKTFLNYMDTGTGYATAFITPDSERTFATYLGAALEIHSDMLKNDHFSGYDFFHFEGYLVPNHKLVTEAIMMAKEEGAKISIDMASYNIVEENLEFLKKIISEHVDIVFANEEEAKSLTGKNPEEALNEISEMCDIAVVKIGSKGSLIKHKGNIYKVGVIKANSKDTTGAGDLYASGFLYGLLKGYSLDKCGQIGALLSGKVIEVIGAKMDHARWKEILSFLKTELK
ncbi:MAG: adenosine kinase [Bacteroidota bacterium]|nr:adenosine kinase [Bacteroidota bacterium]